MGSPFFSVIIPVYNRRGFLKIAVESVLRQSFSDLELIVIDDGSTRETRESLRCFDDSRLRYVYQPHGGVSKARNHGILLGKGKYFCFLDSDDRFLEDKLAVTRKYIRDFPNYLIFHTQEIWYKNGGLLAQKKRHSKPDGNVFETALRLCCISISTACVSKELFSETGVFDENLPACEDYDLWLRACARYPVKLIPGYLTIKQGGHPDQLSGKYPGMDRFRIQAISKILKDENLSPKAREQARRELIKKCLVYVNGAKKRGKTGEIIYYERLLKEHGTGLGKDKAKPEGKVQV